MAAAVAGGGDQFLVAQCAGDPAGLCVLPRGAALCDRAHAQCRCRRSGARTFACDQLGRGRHHRVPHRLADRRRRLARIALGRYGRRSVGCAQPHPADAGQRRGRGLHLSCGCLAGLGLCRCADGPADRSRRFRCRLRRPDLADRASVGHSPRRRAIRLSHRKRAPRAARQLPLHAHPAAHRGHPSNKPARHRADLWRHDRRRPFRRMGGIPRCGGSASGAGRAHAHPARQPRPQHCRSSQPGTARSAVQPDQAPAADASAVGDRRHAGRAGFGSRSRLRQVWPHAGASAGVASKADR